MKRKLLQARKMLLVAAALLVGASAWGATTTYDFMNYVKNVKNLAQGSSSQITITRNTGGVLQDLTDFAFNGRFSANSDNLKFRNGNNGNTGNTDNNRGLQNISGTTTLNVLDLKVGDVVTIVAGTGTTIVTSTNATVDGASAENKSIGASGNGDGVQTVFNITEAGDLVLSLGEWAVIMSVAIESSSETVTVPTLAITGANGVNRTVTMTPGTSNIEGATVEVYYTTNGDTPTKDNGTKYTEPVTVSATTTFTAATISSEGGVSLNTELIVEAGTTIKLADPIVKLSEMTKVEELYNPTYTFTADATGTYGSPAITLTATFDDAAIDNASYTATAAGTIKVVAKAEGYDESDAVEVVVPGVGYEVLTSYDVKDFYPNVSGEWPENLDYNKIPGLTLNPVNLTQGCTYRTTHNSDQYYAYYGRNKGFTVTCDGLTADMMVMIENHTRADKYVLTADNNSVEISKDGSFRYYTLYAQPGTTISATIGVTGYTTFASNYALDLTTLPEGLTAYYASAANETSVTLKEATGTVAAGEGLILVGNTDTYEIPVAASGEAIEGNLLKGCTTETTLTANANQYVLANNDGTAEFQCLAEYGATIPAGKAYLEVPAAGARTLSIVIGDETTGIAEVATAGTEDGAVYNLSGQRVSQPAQGLYIVNGKKVIIK